MRRKQWYISVALFLVSCCFLLFSTSLFKSPQPSTEPELLPSSQVAQCNVTILTNNDFYPVLKNHIQGAKKKILGTVFLIHTTSHKDNEPSDLLNEFVAAQKRGVHVELVLDISGEDRDSKETNLQAGAFLQKAGVKVRYDVEAVSTHSKTFVIDDRYSFVGSHNLTHAAMARNSELSLLVDSPEIARNIETFISQIPLSASP